MMHENTMIPSGCIRDFPAGNRYLFCVRMWVSVRHRMRPLIRSRKLSSALVMIDKLPLLYAAKTLIQSNATLAQKLVRNANSSRRRRRASFKSSASSCLADASLDSVASPSPSKSSPPFRSIRFSISAKFSTSAFCFR